MTPQARDLALSILTRIKERDGTANKTKLLKLLYLADIEHYRVAKETLTGFHWIFYLYGPWAQEYDSLLQQLQAEDAIKMEPWSGGGIEGEQIVLTETAQLKKIGTSLGSFLRTRRFVDFWADQGVSSLLDYVYFETEPMRGAVKMERLDFTKVSDAPPLYRRTNSGTDVKDLRRLKRQFQELSKKMLGERSRIHHDQGPYDETYLKALEVLEEQEG